MIYCQYKVYNDAAESWQIYLQDPATPIAEGMFFFHNYLMFVLISVGLFVCYFLYQTSFTFSKEYDKNIQIFTHSSNLEFVWTIIPAAILLFISIPSFALLYSLDENIEPSLTLKIVGHQWYWTYEFSDFFDLPLLQEINFDSYMVAVSDLSFGSFRLLEVDNRVVLPINTHIRLLVTSADVLHSWALPSFGIKIDACPGRLAQGSLLIKRNGVFLWTV
jgi:cytochrome c oxidase subunit 2